MHKEIQTTNQRRNANEADEVMLELNLDLVISETMLTTLLPGTELYDFHSKRVEYLKGLLWPNANQSQE
jgi:hypothetical protein